MDYRKPICRAMNFIAQNLDRDLSLEEIAGAAAFSPFHFHRIFKAAVGETVGGFTRRLRLETAANRLIAYPDRDITTIALDCGFSSSQNFAKAFKGLFRLTPTNFRKSKIGNRQSNTGNAFRVEPVYDPGIVLKHRWERTDHPTARVEVVPEYRVAYIRKLGNYDNPTHDAAFEELMQWAVPRGYNAKGKIFSVYWDNPEVTPEYKCRVDACITIPKGVPCDGPLDVQAIGGGQCAVAGAKVRDDNFKQAWDALFEWIVRHGFQCADQPNFQRYRNDGRHHPDGVWIVDLYVPLVSL